MAPESTEGAPLLLGGELSPLGNGVAFLHSEIEDVLHAVVEARKGATLDVRAVGQLPEAAAVLDPMEAPWTVELIVDCGEWTGYFNNFIGGGDVSAIAPAVARLMNVECVTAQHAPRHGPGHAATQLWMQGPGGEPPLMSVRTLSAHCQDGRWRWYESGELQPFEASARYGARRIRDRLDRPLLIEYLHQLGIRVDDRAFFGDAVAVRQVVDWTPRQETVAAWRAANARTPG